MRFSIFLLLAVAGACAGSDIYDFPKTCDPGVNSIRHYCNICMCTEDGSISDCTKIFCLEGTFNKDGSIKEHLHALAGEPAVPETKLKGSKKDIHLSGVFNDLDADKDPTQQNDNDNSSDFVFDKEKPIYRKKRALRWLANKNEAMKDRTLFIACQPSSNFKTFCNDCTCSPSGTSAKCTKKDCSQGVWTTIRKLITQKYSAVSTSNNALPIFCRPGQNFFRAGKNCKCVTPFKYDCQTPSVNPEISITENPDPKKSTSYSRTTGKPNSKESASTEKPNLPISRKAVFVEEKPTEELSLTSRFRDFYEESSGDDDEDYGGTVVDYYNTYTVTGKPKNVDVVG